MAPSKKKKVITTKFLKDQAEDVYENFVEELHNTLFPDEEWVIINDSTSQENFPLYIHDESYCPIVRLLAQYRLAGKSVWDLSLIEKFEKMTEDNYEESNLVHFTFDSGRFFVLSSMFKELGNNKMAKILNKWAYFSPYE